MTGLWGWIFFGGLIVLLLALDLGIFHRTPHVVGTKEALKSSACWIGLAFIFNAGIYFFLGAAPAQAFLLSYLIEESLSIDNLFVFLVIFNYFHVPPAYQRRILLWGIIGALVMRGLFIAGGITLIQHFHSAIYLFGVLLIVTGIKMVRRSDDTVDLEKNWTLRFIRRWIPVTDNHQGGHFFVKIEGKWRATSLFVVLIMVEATDVIFAVDSVPAVLAITLDPFIVYTSNVFAILGLRALYFSLAVLMRTFHYLHYGLCAILIFIGVKMLISDFYKIPIGWALGGLAGILILSSVVSWLYPPTTENAST